MKHHATPVLDSDEVAMVTGISPDNEAYLQQVVATGQFPSREAALDEAIRALREKSGAHQSERRKKSADQWIKDLREWSNRHPRVAHFVDVSRESIYEGRGE
jgi:hypothetical protein